MEEKHQKTSVVLTDKFSDDACSIEQTDDDDTISSDVFEETNGNEKNIKNITPYLCETCNFKCVKKGDWKRHIARQKHITLTNNLQQALTFEHACEFCNKKYKTRAGLWKHQKMCFKPDDTTTSLISLLVQQNADLAKMQTENMGVFTEKITNLVLELCKNGITNMNNSQYANNSHNNNNSHNKFNLQFFLNETCKNAMNIMDFVESIQLQVSDLERIGELGYVKGMSEIITTNLKAMDISLRPIHCTDKKRETMYIRDNNEWKKEEDNKPYLRKAIKKIEDRNMRLFPQYRAKYPDHNNPHSKQSDKYDKMVLEALGGSKNEKDNIERIIRNISEVTIVDK